MRAVIYRAARARRDVSARLRARTGRSAAAHGDRDRHAGVGLGKCSRALGPLRDGPACLKAAPAPGAPPTPIMTTRPIILS
jgi:hypothetical protein